MRHLLFITIFTFLFAPYWPKALAHTANKIWFEFRDDGRYRVYVNYTVPELKEFREAYVDFKNRRKAEAYYWHLVRGGDFHRGTPDTTHFHTPPVGPDPW